ncbi:MAG TPA: long-chain fatty acid--CoA ligase [Alphaproteobacteria bacterium]|nr:long-chain fatty acid--CoA ligase [Alphaproteobacteria bacterium]
MNERPWLKAYAPGVDWHAPLLARPLYRLLDEAVARFGARPAVDFLGYRLSYAELGRLANRVAAGLQRLGVGKGSKVGLFLPNCPQFVACYYGILKTGATVVNFSPLYSEEELLLQIEDSETDFMVTLDLAALYPKMRVMLRESRLGTLIVGSLPEVLPFPKNWLFRLFRRGQVAAPDWDDAHLGFARLTDNDGRFEPVEIAPEEDVAVLLYTGGTTGTPKGAMLTHANLYINAQQATLWMPDCRPGEERMLGVLPFFHSFAMTVVMNTAINIGAEIIMHPRFELEAVMKEIPRKKPTLMPGVPTMYAAIANHPRARELDMTSLKGCMSGGAPLPLELKQRFEQLTGSRLFEGYGLTETSPVAACNPLDGVNKPGSIGIPMPGTDIVITDREDPGRELPLGEPGEICIRGPQVMKGYYRRPEETAKCLIDGLLHTGDVGYMDEDGYTFIIDRMKDLILVGGFNVYPRHVEEAIYQHPAVAECTVVGVPDDYRGQSVKAFVKLRQPGEIDADKLLEFLRPKLGKHELPRAIEFRDELPKTMIGKLSKKELVEEELARHQERRRTGQGDP